MVLAAAVSGCGTRAASRPTPRPSPSPTATVDVSFVVAVTPVPTAGATPRPTPTPTAFVPPSSPYLHLSQSAGAPSQRTVTVQGGHLPASTEVELEWTAGNHAPITTIARTNASGRLTTQFTIPASPPGTYRVLAVVNGVTYATAVYHVLSLAGVTVSVAPAGRGEILEVHGKGFVPGTRVLLIIYSLDGRIRPFTLARVSSGRRGRFQVGRIVRRLPLGQYALRAYTEGGLAAQMAETYFQVVI